MAGLSGGKATEKGHQEQYPLGPFLMKAADLQGAGQKARRVSELTVAAPEVPQLKINAPASRPMLFCLHS